MKFKLVAEVIVDLEKEVTEAKEGISDEKERKERLASIYEAHDKRLADCKEVDLSDLTYDQRVECETLMSGTMMQVGTIIKIVDPERYYQARTKLCMYGMKLENAEELNRFSSEELAEISSEVLGRATAGANPT